MTREEKVLKALREVAGAAPKVRVPMQVLAQKAGITVSEARNAVRELEGSGVLVVTRPMGGGWWYHLPESEEVNAEIVGTVMQGEIPINSVWLLVDQPDAKIFLVECSAKHPEVGPSSAGDDEMVVTLAKGPHTLHADGDAGESTRIVISGLGAGWFLDASAGRYSVYVFCWKEGTTRRPIWEKAGAER
jgi:hypothetical protein